MIDTDRFAARGMVDAIAFETELRAPRAQVYRAWTTSDGIMSFLGTDANVDLAIGGAMEILFRDEDAPAGERGSEGCQVLAYVPNEMLAFSWNAPPELPEERAMRTWVVVTFTDAERGCRVRLQHVGFGEGGRWAEVREYFLAAWPNVMEALRARFA